jgi:hypothetical protein
MMHVNELNGAPSGKLSWVALREEIEGSRTPCRVSGPRGQVALAQALPGLASKELLLEVIGSDANNWLSELILIVRVGSSIWGCPKFSSTGHGSLPKLGRTPTGAVPS